jgi:Fic family protein
VATVVLEMNPYYNQTMIHYLRPEGWMQYNRTAILDELSSAKAAVLSLQTVPYQKRWVERLQKMELKREIAGTSRIEGAEFTTRELDSVMKEETPDELYTRSQRQARSALTAYEWIKTVPRDRPVDQDLIRQIHRFIVTGADDDHCEPGVLRSSAQNVTFGNPAHRGVDGGEECAEVFAEFADAIQNEFRGHDPLIQAIAAHFHLAAMHPFLDGNGRTARALEALLLTRAGLRVTTFIAMSNYYYDEKTAYLASLAAVRQANDLTPFLRFALRGVELQAKRLLTEIQREIKRELYRTMMHDLFGRLRSPRKRLIVERQLFVLNTLLPVETMTIRELLDKTGPKYDTLKSGLKGFIRDMNALFDLGAVKLGPKGETVTINLDWPTEMTESEFFDRVKKMPTATTSSWLIQ